MIAEFRNRLDYRLRQLFRWRRSGLRLVNEPKDDLFIDLDEEIYIETRKTAKRLFDNYYLENLYKNSRRRKYCENLYYLDLLEKALQSAEMILPARVYAADIGTADWFYVRAYYAFLKWWNCESGREVFMNCYEVDAYRVYNDLYSRMDYAMMYSGDLQNVEFIPRTFEMQPDTFDIVTLFFPFVFIKDHLKWGLPDILFKLKDMISDTWDSLKIGGVMVIVNQGEAENRKQRDELDELDIPILSSFKHESTLFSYEIPRYVILVIKNG